MTSKSIEEMYQKLEKRQWDFYVNRRFNWYLESTQIKANSNEAQSDVLGFSLACPNYLILNGYEYGFNGDHKENARHLEEMFQNDHNFFAKFRDKIIDIVAEVEQYKKSLERENFFEHTPKQLKVAHEKFFAIYLKSFIPGWSRPDDYLQNKLAGIIRQKTEDEKKREEIFSAIAVCPSEKLSELIYVNEPIDLALIAKEIKNGSHDIDNLPREIEVKLENHVQRYSWLKSPVAINEDSFVPEDYRGRLKNLLQKDLGEFLENIDATRKDQTEKYQSALAETNFTSEEKKIIEAVRDFIFLRTYSTEASDSLFYSARTSLFEAIARKLRIPSREAVMLSWDEIDDYLSRPDDGGLTNEAREIAERRRESYSIIWLDGEVTIYAGKESADLSERIREAFIRGDESVGKIDEIRGSVGCKGFARGRVCVVLDALGAQKMQVGDILVSSMTTPDIISAMEKAGAFVTDEGGITCHAAIVAREFKKPCIIGTKIATQVLKDGDLVEVDANEGVVRVLKK
ncbi:MAG: hypothetical protein ACD_15C00111G0019 [uncultured bacterium]|nr:MAG: hypothetical protein ACD_15C00111G0019 [uncultured bacterium]